MSFGYQSENNSSSGTNGGVFITDITPQASGNVGGKNFSSDGKVLDHCVTDTDLITVHVIAITGGTNYKPLVTVEGVVVPLTEEEDRTLWSGSVNIDRNGATLITAIHEDGTRHYCTLANDVGPVVTQAVFAGGYPNAQTELKAGDTYALEVTTDSDMVAIEVIDQGAAQQQLFSIPSATTTSIEITIADRGNSTQAVGASLRCQNATGSWGPVFDTSSQGSTDGVHTLQLNNTHPGVSPVTITYPAGQTALKDNESATVSHTVTGADTIIYDSPNGELGITDPFDYSVEKTVTRIGGDYNVMDSNFRITALRVANGATTIENVVVAIAHVAPVLSITLPASRLVSGGNQGTTPQQYMVTLTSDQGLGTPPVISASGGTLLGSMVQGSQLNTWEQVLEVHDNDAKGSHSFGVVSATNRAGVDATQITTGSSYVLGGFVERTLPVPAFEHELDIGTNVYDHSQLLALDKDLAILSYASDLQETTKTYTLTGPSGVQNPNGNLFHWLDSQAVANNTTGGATITLEENA